eukprot:6448398-Pyramimonas_sp.AAC.1
MADPARVLLGSNIYPIELRLRRRAEIRSNITGKNTRALTNGWISGTKFSTEQMPAKVPSRFFLPTRSPAPRNSPA